MEKIDKKAVGARIRAIRLANGMTLREFGKLFETSASIALRWETGFNVPKADRLLLIAKFANTTIPNLLYGETENNKRYMYGIEWWNGKSLYASEQKPLPMVFASEEAANDWLISKGYYQEPDQTFADCFDYTRAVPVSHLNEWPEEEFARIFKMEVVE